MGRIKINGLYIDVPDNILIQNGEITKAHEVESERTLDEAEVQRLIEIKKIDSSPNPNDLASIHIAQVSLIEKAAKSKRKGPRLFFYIVLALIPASCMEALVYKSAKLEKISWAWTWYFGIAISLVILQILLIATEKSKK